MSRRTGQYGSVELRNGSWRGRYLVDIPGQFERVKRSVILGSAKSKSNPKGMTKSAAHAKLKELILQTGINSADYKIPSVLTFEQHAEQWEESYVKRMKPSNRKQLRFVLRKYLIPKWAKVPVDSINAERVNQWVGEKELSHLSPVTIRNIVRTLQFALVRKFGKGKINYPSQVEEEQEARCFTSAEVAAIMAAASGTHKVLFTLAAESGMRAGELYGLRVEDIDFERSVVKVRRSMWEGAAQAPKSTNAYRAIDVQPYVTEMLKAHLAGRTEGLVFMSRRRTPLRNTTIVGKHLHPLLRRFESGTRRNACIQTFPRFIPRSERNACGDHQEVDWPWERGNDSTLHSPASDISQANNGEIAGCLPRLFAPATASYNVKRLFCYDSGVV